MFRRILIANRGEVVNRVLRTARRLGIEVVVVHSEADRDAPYVAAADAAVCLGPAPSAQSYLLGDRVIQAAIQTGATAVHPGWGFLSERPDFVERCRQHGLTFVGPPPEVMRLMGKKLRAKAAAAEAGLDVIPGSLGLVATVDEARAIADEVGYPVLLKADSGGGGRGMRRCDDPAGLEEAFRSARAEAEAAFGDGGLYLERYLEGGRHIEVQILADAFGHAIHLGERECSIQRNHQKLLEESPSPALDDATRDAVGRRAARAAAAIGYTGAGTIEFLLGDDGVLRFMEMNTRLQVEHPVTEVRCGLDLVEHQLRVAAGEPLALTQDDVRLAGHAIEVRINAEDPDDDFRPGPGRVDVLEVPAGVRFDTYLEPGTAVPPYYDSLIGKLIVHAEDRPACIARLEEALTGLKIEGVPTTRMLHQRIAASPEFREGNYDTRRIPGLEA